VTELRWPAAAALADSQQQGPAPPAPPRGAGGPADPRLQQGVAEIHAMVASKLEDGAPPEAILPLIRDAARTWAERRVRAGASVPSPADREALAQAVYDQRYGLGPLASYLRDPAVENIDINGCDQVWVTYATGERVMAPPVAASDEALVEMIRTWAADHKVELCFTPTYASWANPIEAHFGPLRTFVVAGSNHPNHIVATRALQAYLRWRNANTRHPDVLAAQRRERARVRSERHHTWGQRPATRAA